jgi:hypothetical protein
MSLARLLASWLGSRARLGPLVSRIALTPKPSRSAVASDPGLGFVFGLEAGDFLGMAAGPGRPYVPFVPNLQGTGINCDSTVKIGHARQYAPGLSRWLP